MNYITDSGENFKWTAGHLSTFSTNRMGTNSRQEFFCGWVLINNSHAIDFDNASIIDKGGFRTRKTLEAWHSKLTPNADNNSCPLPGQYNILFNKHSQLSAFLIFTLYFTPSIFHLFIILPVEGCSTNSRKLVFFKRFSQRSFFKFHKIIK